MLPLTVKSGAAHTNPVPVGFISAVLIVVGMTPSMSVPVMASTPSVECSAQSHVVMPDVTPTHGEGHPPLPSDPFTALTPVRV